MTLSVDNERRTITLEEVLHNNRFAVLATLHDPPHKRQSVVDTRVLYHVHLGKDNIVSPHVVPAAMDAMGTNFATTSTFFGQCYNCHYRAHSQKHCPLRQCTRCGFFGHSDFLCPLLTDTPSVE